MKKLVKLDPVTKRYCEVDRVKLDRVTQELLDFIHKEVVPANDPHQIWECVVPLCEGVLRNTLKLPLPYDQLPLKYQMRERLLLDEFEEKYAAFSNAITGTPLAQTEKIEIDGDLYTYADFED